MINTKNSSICTGSNDKLNENFAFLIQFQIKKEMTANIMLMQYCVCGRGGGGSQQMGKKG